MTKYTIRLEGEAATGDISLRAVAALSEMLIAAAKKSLRLRLEGRSTLVGSTWLDPATDIKLVGLKTGSTVLELNAPSINDSLKGKHAQLSLWGEPIPASATAMTFVEDAFRDAVLGKKESDILDRNILDSVSDFGRIFEYGFDAFTMNGVTAADPIPLRVTIRELQKVEELRFVAPPPQNIVVSGILDAIVASRRTFTLLVPNGAATLRGVLPGGDIRAFTRFIGQSVVLDGEAYFRPSGSVLNIRASHIAEASDAGRAFGHIPRPAAVSLSQLKPRLASPLGVSGMEHVFGKWPGTETDAELLATLKELDR